MQACSTTGDPQSQRSLPTQYGSHEHIHLLFSDLPRATKISEEAAKLTVHELMNCIWFAVQGHKNVRLGQRFVDLTMVSRVHNTRSLHPVTTPLYLALPILIMDCNL